ncbi:preprotein translocase subunit YajC [Pelotomaculum terephthalicicum JT]|uniref:preprotein translocase subunit YajC n=1 Tax=Pelotomaculum TaxID=191373 RepID=UPI0009CBCA5B|nr:MULTISPECIES: preprotein translocase subunit YajC [Pelotomaculum]MCG9969824.1 preprotein translocase subunit YajC [Pelotomaculum terephthalicicum JT]OPX85310.1 MAG: preprotein translocase subunit YajC [Pelotomaculum sp. PtaB.Bin117]OPY62381.1 MAG: preprotein translocase subunit YajC [Pelotomaculum sp. PtaU1.Bin065]
MGINSQYASILYIVVLFAILYFLMIRPQQQRQKRLQEMINNLKVGDRVITVGGMYGTIDKIKDDFFIIKVSDNVRIKFQKNAVGQVVSDETD